MCDDVLTQEVQFKNTGMNITPKIDYMYTYIYKLVSCFK